MNEKLRIAVQKSGRLSEKSVDIFRRCGIDLDQRKARLLTHSRNFPIEFMLVRDDDIPHYVRDGVCDLGVVGENVVLEKLQAEDDVSTVRRLGFGRCRLSLAVPAETDYEAADFFAGKKVATSYPRTLRRFFDRRDINAEIIEISGSVEIAPSLKLAEGVCDLVSTGSTLSANGLREVETILESECLLIGKKSPLCTEKEEICKRLLQRVDGVLKAMRAKYVMMNAPEAAVEKIIEMIPGMEEPTVMPLAKSGMVAIHAVAYENVFWETMEQLKGVGASSILVVPIEKVID